MSRRQRLNNTDQPSKQQASCQLLRQQFHRRFQTASYGFAGLGLNCGSWTGGSMDFAVVCNGDIVLGSWKPASSYWVGIDSARIKAIFPENQKILELTELAEGGKDAIVERVDAELEEACETRMTALFASDSQKPKLIVMGHAHLPKIDVVQSYVVK